jgi:hypothetical protein
MQASREIERSSSSTVLGKVPILELENSEYHAIIDSRIPDRIYLAQDRI